MVSKRQILFLFKLLPAQKCGTITRTSYLSHFSHKISKTMAHLSSRTSAHVSPRPAAPAPCNFVNGISYMTLLIGILVRCVSALQKKSTFLLNGRSRNIGKSSTLWWRWVIIIEGSRSGIGTIYIPSLISGR